MTDEEIYIEKKKKYMREILAEHYQKAQTHITLVSGAAYIGFFTAWNTVASSIPSYERYFSLMLMIFSLVIFIGWELLKMIKQALLQKQQVALLMTPNESYLEVEKGVLFAEQEMVLLNQKIWPAVLFLTYIPGVAAAIFLITGCLKDFFETI